MKNIVFTSLRCGGQVRIAWIEEHPELLAGAKVRLEGEEDVCEVKRVSSMRDKYAIADVISSPATDPRSKPYKD